eukprot:TRINITY_DN69497_c0_g1_i1.p1 TRINITY_DN69497_c0_g1~~TRINITY_DN69497_c0_g1_i1.p1  ORF type:complete len:278 (+),score=37.90 TRINITY_DN69497_c0_g1_i1:50-835(+)
MVSNSGDLRSLQRMERNESDFAQSRGHERGMATPLTPWFKAVGDGSSNAVSNSRSYSNLPSDDGCSSEAEGPTDDLQLERLSRIQFFSNKTSRHIALPGNMFGLAIAATGEPAIPTMQKFTLFGFMYVNVMMQLFLMHALDGISAVNTGPEICNSNPLLQWVATFIYVVIVWEEISASMDCMEFIVNAKGDACFCPGGAEDTRPEGNAEWSSINESQVAASADSDWVKCHGSFCSEHFAILEDDDEIQHRVSEGWLIKAGR